MLKKILIWLKKKLNLYKDTNIPTLRGLPTTELPLVSVPPKEKFPTPYFYVKGSHGKRIVKVHDEEMFKAHELAENSRKIEGRKWQDPWEKAMENIQIEYDDRI